MERAIHIYDKLGSIVSKYPAAQDIFINYNIDFCCGGNRTLREAIKGMDIVEKRLLNHLNEGYKKYLNADSKENDFTNDSTEQLIHHIINTHHDYLRRELPNINKLVLKIYEVHGERHEKLLLNVKSLFTKLKKELESHLEKEETLIFPLIQNLKNSINADEKEKIIEKIKELEEEHDKAGSILKTLRQLTNHFKMPEDGCQTFNFTYRKLEELEKDLFQHIHLENNILFKNL